MGCFEYVQTDFRCDAPVPKLHVVFTICEVPVVGMINIINQLWGWSYHGIRRWAIERWDGDPLLVTIHNCPMEHTLVTIIAKYLHYVHGFIITNNKTSSQGVTRKIKYN